MYHYSRCPPYVECLLLVAIGVWIPVIGYDGLTGDVPLRLRWTAGSLWGLFALLSIVVPGVSLMPERYWWAKACCASCFFVVLWYVLERTEMSFLYALFASIMVWSLVGIAFQLALERIENRRWRGKPPERTE
jgi:hypothetical protein